MFKKILYATFAFFVLFGFAAITSAQGFETESQTSLFVKEIKLDKATYKAGDTVTGTFTLYSQGDNAIPDAYYAVSLAGDYGVNTLANVIYDTKQFGPVYIDGNSSKSIPFSYTLPPAISGAGLGIQIQGKLRSGMPMGWSDTRLTVTGGLPYMTVTDAYVKVNKDDFDVQAGPVVKKGDTVSAVVSLKNTNKTDITVSTDLKTYNRTKSQDLLSDTKGDVITVKAGSTKDITISLPTFDYTPKVYESVLSFVDSDNIERAASVSYRYIVDGPIATIQSVTSDKGYAEKGDKINLTIFLTGTPRDIQDKTLSTPANAEISIVLTNEKGEVVGSGTTTENLTASQSQIDIQARISKRSSALSAKITVSEEGNELATYSTSLSETPHDFSRGDLMKILTWSVSIVVALILLMVAFFIFKKNKKAGIVVVSLLVLIGGIAIFTLARAQNTNSCSGSMSGSLCITERGGGNKDSNISSFFTNPITIGTDGNYYITGNAVEFACQNTAPLGLNYTVNYPYPDDGTLVTSAHRGQDFIGTGQHHAYHTMEDQFSMGPFKAISGTGTHKVSIELGQYWLSPTMQKVNIVGVEIKGVKGLDFNNAVYKQVLSLTPQPQFSTTSTSVILSHEQSPVATSLCSNYTMMNSYKTLSFGMRGRLFGTFVSGCNDYLDSLGALTTISAQDKASISNFKQVLNDSYDKAITQAVTYTDLYSSTPFSYVKGYVNYVSKPSCSPSGVNICNGNVVLDSCGDTIETCTPSSSCISGVCVCGLTGPKACSADKKSVLNACGGIATQCGTGASCIGGVNGGDASCSTNNGEIVDGGNASSSSANGSSTNTSIESSGGGAGVSASCTLDGLTVQNGSSSIFYKSSISESCASSTLSCVDGILSGGDTSVYKYKKCVSPKYKEY